MFVLKRDGHKEPVMFDKITARIRKLCYGLNPLVDPVRVSMRVIEGLYDGVTTSELDNLAAEVAATMTTSHPDYTNLASRISVSNLHKNTKKSFSEINSVTANTFISLPKFVTPIENSLPSINLSIIISLSILNISTMNFFNSSSL